MKPPVASPNEEVQARLNERRERLVARNIAAISGTNRALAEAFMRSKVRKKSSTRQIYSVALEKADSFLNGRPLAGLQNPDLVARFLSDLKTPTTPGKRSLKPGTIDTIATCVKGWLTWHLGVEKLPRLLRETFKPEGNRKVDGDRIVSNEDFLRFHAALPTLMDQCFAALLWEAGFRVAEGLALYVDSVEFDDKGGAWVILPNDGPDLKTGTRRVYVTGQGTGDKDPVPVVPLLRAHMQTLRQTGRTPLWTGDSNRNKGRRIYKNHVQNRWKRAFEQCGVDPFTPHDLRHTAATRDAENGANESDLRAKYGWGPTSKMPNYYVQQRRVHRENVARRSLGLNLNGVREDVAQAAETQECPFCVTQIPRRALKCGNCKEWVKEPPANLPLARRTLAQEG